MELKRENILDYASRYDRNYTGTPDILVEEEVKKLLKKQRYLTREDLIKIGLWKSRRAKKHYEDNNDLTVREITKFSFSTKSEEAQIKSLTALNGVSFPVASTILHFAFPDKYPIMDFRVIWSLGWEQPRIYDFSFWQKYCNEIRALSKKLRLPLRVIDKALWQYSKENKK